MKNETVLERTSNLVMPSHYVELDMDEMSYVDGGWRWSWGGFFSVVAGIFGVAVGVVTIASGSGTAVGVLSLAGGVAAIIGGILAFAEVD